MRRGKQSMVLVVILAGLALSACQSGTVVSAVLPTAGIPDVLNNPEKTKPATVEHIEGTELSRVTLTSQAAERFKIETTLVRETRVGQPGSETLRLVVPYSSVLYDTQGNTWTYTSPKPLVYVRDRITIDYIEGDLAILSKGPAVGTTIVTVGGALLLGTEFEVGH